MLCLLMASLSLAVCGCSGLRHSSEMALAPTQATTKILFIGNSHTEFNNLTGMVKTLLEESATSGTVSIEKLLCGTLEDLKNNREIEQRIRSGKWKFVVLQAQQISMSHKYSYSDEVAVRLGRAAKESGARVLYFAEWPREWVEESKQIYNIYSAIAKKVGGEVVPVGFAFDAALKQSPQLKLWARDGNHSSPLGAYLAACAFYYWAVGDDAKQPIVPSGSRIDATTASVCIEAAKKACKEYRQEI